MTKRYRDEHGYEGEYETRRPRLRRNKIDGVFGGVCAGLGDHFDVDPFLVRVLFVIALIMSGGIMFWVYIGFWIFVPSDKRAPYRREYRQAAKAKRENPVNPAQTASFRDVKSKFRSLETRLQDLERSITSSEWQLRRDFRDLEN